MTSIWGEIRRRNVFRVGIAYLAAIWALIQVADVVLPNLGAPAWIIQALLLSSAIGFPLALVLAWFYEWTPQGIRTTTDLPAAEEVKFLGRRLDFVIIGLLVVAVGFLVGTIFLQGEPLSSARLATMRSIAVLPFSNESAAKENAEFFTNGMHGELLTRLAKIGSLKVISGTSVEEYRDSPKNLREIGQELDVATILEGRVQRTGGMARINVQLIDAVTDETVWAEAYDRDLTAQNIFAIQREMATSIAAAMQATLSPQDEARLNEVPTENTEALNFYLTGNEYLDRNEGLAAQQYKRAVEKDPEFAHAWAALSHAYSSMYWTGADPTLSRLDLALDAANHALRLEPNLPEAHLALGRYYHLGVRDSDRALAEYAIAEQRLIGSAELFEAQAMIYRRVGEFEKSIVSLDRAIELDPRNTDMLRQQAATHLSRRDYAEVETYLERVLEITPDSGWAYRRRTAYIPMWRDGDIANAKAIAESSQGTGREHYYGWLAALYDRDIDTALRFLDEWDTDLDAGTNFYVPKASYYGTTYRLAGRDVLAERAFQTARVRLDDARAANPDDSRLLVSLGEAMVGLGEHVEGVRLARRAMDLRPSEKDALTGPEIQLDAVMRVFAPAGEYDAMIKELDTYLAGPGRWSIEGLLPDPRLDPIRDDPRFRVVVEKYRRQ